jgi:hypothetical protein
VSHYPWRELVKALLLLASGIGLGARMAGASLWWGLAGFVLLSVWLVVLVSEPGPDDPGQPGRGPRRRGSLEEPGHQHDLPRR